MNGYTTLRETKRKFFRPPCHPDFDVQRCAQRGLRADGENPEPLLLAWTLKFWAGGADAPQHKFAFSFAEGCRRARARNILFQIGGGAFGNGVLVVVALLALVSTIHGGL